MIKSFADARTLRFYESGKAAKFRGLDIETAEDLPAALDAATALSDLSPLKSVNALPYEERIQRIQMPILSMFFGIIIRMCYDDHDPPHFHAEYQGMKAVFDFRGVTYYEGSSSRERRQSL